MASKIAEGIIKEGKWEEGAVPTGAEVVDAMIRFYDKHDMHPPYKYHNILHQIAMRVNPMYRNRQYALRCSKLQHRWDERYNMK
jgi:hypothetical protein